MQTTTWDQINMCYGDDCSNILKLIDLILTIPATSAENERGFSLMKQIKNKFRTRLNNESLNDRMAISLLTDDVQNFNPTAYVHAWYAAKCRRLRDTRVDLLEAESSDKSEEEDSFDVDDQEDDYEISEREVELYMFDIDNKLHELNEDPE